MELTDFLIPVLTFVAVMAIGGGVLAMTRRSKAAERLSKQLGTQGASASLASHAESSMATPGLSANESYGLIDALGRLVAGGGVSSKLRQNLARAGYFGDAAAPVYLGVKMLLLIIALVAGAGVVLGPGAEWSGLIKGVVVIWLAGFLFFIPNIVVDVARRRRSKEVREHLPDAVDLLEVCVSSGMGLDMAWNAVTEEVRPVSTVLADEMTLANLEMQLGSPRAVAMRRMAERTGAEELSSLVAMFVQTERFGTSVAETLRTFATSMREGRSQRAEEAAEKMAVKLLFPMVLFIFPVTLVTTVGPAALGIVEMMSKN